MFFLLDKDGWTKGAVEVTDGTNIPGRHPNPKMHVGQVPHDGEQVLWSDAELKKVLRRAKSINWLSSRSWGF